MKKGLLLLLLMAGAFTIQAQSLKDLLYGGKLKSDSNSVVRKTDDLKAKMDTGQKKRVVVDTVKAIAAAPADSVKRVSSQADTLATALNTVADSALATAPVAVAAPAAPVKTNTKIWKEYTDSLVVTMKPEIDNAKKIKKDTYHVLVSYEIDTAGVVNITNVGITPENAMLQTQLKQYMEVTPPKLNPVLDSAQQPRKVKRSGSFTITKE